MWHHTPLNDRLIAYHLCIVVAAACRPCSACVGLFAACRLSFACVLQVCKEAEITEISKQSEEMIATNYLSATQRDMTGDFTTKLPGEMGAYKKDYGEDKEF